MTNQQAAVTALHRLIQHPHGFYTPFFHGTWVKTHAPWNGEDTETERTNKKKKRIP